MHSGSGSARFFQMLLLLASVTLVGAGSASAVTVLDADFEGAGLSNWIQIGNPPDDFDWTQRSGSTPSSSTGPSSSHDGSDYIYTEATGGSTGDVASLESPCVDLTGMSSAHLDFWTHLYGSDMGTLDVEVSASVGQTCASPGAFGTVFSVSGNQGNQWSEVVVDLDAYAGKSIQIRLVGTRGNGYRSDISVDDLTLTATPAIACSTDIDCQDADQCTDNACVAGFCQSSFNTSPCDDGLACTAGDVCSAGVCGGADACGPGASCSESAGVCEAFAAQSLVDALDIDRYKALIYALSNNEANPVAPIPPIHGSRNWDQPGNAVALDYIQAELESYGYTVIRHAYVYSGQTKQSIYVTKVGDTTPEQMYIVSAHMDSYNTQSTNSFFAPGANDDGSGTALVLEAARVFGDPSIRTDKSVRFILWNNEETGLNGSSAYVNERRQLQGIEEPAGSGLYPEPTWLGVIQHDMMMWDHGPTGGPVQVPDADNDIEFQASSTFASASEALAHIVNGANVDYAPAYPGEVSNDMCCTDSVPFEDYAPAISVRENRRRAEIGNGSNPNWHKNSDVYETYSDLDFALGFNALQASVGAVAELIGATTATASGCGDGTLDAGEQCDDGNFASGDCCDAACQFEALGSSCEDGDACTVADACNGAAVCVAGGALDADDGNVCTDDSCDPLLGAVHANNTGACNDGSVCTTIDTCSAGVCVGGVPLVVDDANGCTDDFCDPLLGAMHANNTASCDDGNACTAADQCSAGTCVSGNPLIVDDGNACTDDACDPAVGAVYVNNTASCDDGNVCTTFDSCSGGACLAGSLLEVDDANACTDDYCDPALGEMHSNNVAPCADGNACTVGDVCSAGACAPGTPLDVDDGNFCTDDSCDPILGAVSVDNTLPCDDGDACTGQDVCGGGTCVAGAPVSCEVYACSDELDNDGDDRIDYPSDFECASPNDPSETGSPLVATVDFTQMGDLSTPVLYTPGLAVTTWEAGGAPSDIVLVQSADEFGGVGAAGGANPIYVDLDEVISFDFGPGSVIDLSYRMHQDAPAGQVQPFSPYKLTVWDPDQNVTFSEAVHRVGTVDVSSIIGHAIIGRFEIESMSGYPIQISQLTYLVPPACSDGYDNDGDALVDFPADPECLSASGKEVGTPFAATVDFTQSGDGVFAHLDLGSLWIDASDAASGVAEVVLTTASDEFGGLGVEGGSDSDLVDGGESLRFDFAPGRAYNVSYRMHQLSSSLPEVLFTSYVVTIWDPAGNALFSQTLAQVGNVNVSALVGNQAIGGFSVESQPGGNGLRISQISYDAETRQVGTLKLRSMGAEDGRLREFNETSDRGGYANATKTGSAALRVGDQRKDKQWMSLLSFDSSVIPPGADITRASLHLTRGATSGDPQATHGQLLIDVQTGGFGGVTALAKSDFEASATAPAAGQLTVDAQSAFGVFGPSGMAAINRGGVTQVRIRFELDDDDDGTADYLGFHSGSSADEGLQPALEIEYEFWAP